MLFDSFFQVFGAIGMVSWFVWPFAFVFGLKRTIFYMRAPDDEDAAAQEQRGKKGAVLRDPRRGIPAGYVLHCCDGYRLLAGTAGQ